MTESAGALPRSAGALDSSGQFMRRVYFCSVGMGMIVAAGCLERWGLSAAVSVLVGTAVSGISIFAVECGVRRYFRPGVKSLRPLMAWTTGTYPFIGAAIWMFARCSLFNLPGLAVGLALPSLMIIVTGLGPALPARPKVDIQRAH